MLTFKGMSSNSEKKDPFEDDTERAIRLPKPTPEIVNGDDDAEDARKADRDSSIDDLEISVDPDELDAERESGPARKKY